MADRRPLTQIAPTAWEHPADRAALNTLRAIPGFDDVVRKVAGFFTERGIRQLFLANAVRVSPTQRPDLWALHTEVCEALDCTTRPELYVTQTPFVNAAAVGFDRPFIVVSSAALEMMDREERRFVLAHEVGHVMSGHTTYITIALILMYVGVGSLPFLAGLAIMPFQLALFEWYRKATLSADRAGLLAVQDPRASFGVFLKLAGGKPAEDTTDLDEFMAQAREYQTQGDGWDTILKILNTVFRDHPFATVRAAELQRWVESGDYQRVVDGTYARRGETPAGTAPLGDDYAEAAGYYGTQARETAAKVNDSIGRARDAFADAWRRRRAP